MTNIVQLRHEQTADEMAAEIRNDLTKSVENLLATGDKLIAAMENKGVIPHGEWASFVASIPLNMNIAKRLMVVARHPVLSNRATLRALPASREILWELSKLPDDVIEARIADGTITPAISIRGARELRKVSPRKPGARQPKPKQAQQEVTPQPETHREPKSPQPEPPMAEVEQPTAPPRLQEEAASVQPAKPDTDQAVVADLKARLAEEQRTASLARFAIARLESPDPDAEYDPAAFLTKRKRALKDWDLARLQCAVDVSREKTIAQLREQVGTREDRHTFERQLAALVEWLADVTQDISEKELVQYRGPYARPKPAPASTVLPEPIGSAEPLPDYILTGRLYDFSDMEVPTRPKAKRTRTKR